MPCWDVPPHHVATTWIALHGGSRNYAPFLSREWRWLDRTFAALAVAGVQPWQVQSWPAPLGGVLTNN